MFLVSTTFDHAASINIIIIFIFGKKTGRRNSSCAQRNRQERDERYNKCDLAWSLELNRYGLAGGL